MNPLSHLLYPRTLWLRRDLGYSWHHSKEPHLSPFICLAPSPWSSGLITRANWLQGHISRGPHRHEVEQGQPPKIGTAGSDILPLCGNPFNAPPLFPICPFQKCIPFSPFSGERLSEEPIQLDMQEFSIDLWSQADRIRVPGCHLVAVKPWADNSNSLCLSFQFCKMWIIRVAPSQDSL